MTAISERAETVLSGSRSQTMKFTVYTRRVRASRCCVTKVESSGRERGGFEQARNTALFGWRPLPPAALIVSTSSTSDDTHDPEHRLPPLRLRNVGILDAS